MIKSTVVTDSIDRRGNRITSVLVTFPRIILAELNTHRMLSKNSASSRAIPFNKMVKSVEENPFIPIAWQKEHKGMQGTEYNTEKESVRICIENWLKARNNAIIQAKILNQNEVTKQICNRLLEPFMYHTVLITGTDDGWNNFFDLRCPDYTVLPFGVEAKDENRLHFKSRKEVCNCLNMENNLSETDWLLRNKGQAEIHMMALAEAIYDSFNDSIPDLLTDGQWHIPFKFNILQNNLLTEEEHDNTIDDVSYRAYLLQEKTIKIATAMAARTSYTIVGDEKEVSYEKLIEIHDKMLNQKPFHASPFEHCVRVMTDDEYETWYRGDEANSGHLGNPKNQGWCRNYKGFIQYREIIENESVNQI
jgi:hypothetical protein